MNKCQWQLIHIVEYMQIFYCSHFKFFFLMQSNVSRRNNKGTMLISITPPPRDFTKQLLTRFPNRDELSDGP